MENDSHMKAGQAACGGALGALIVGQRRGMIENNAANKPSVQ
jgi:hypothetical protein